nr:Chain P, RH/IN substrate peptide [Human immunodeficiency virus 1]
KVLFLDG